MPLTSRRRVSVLDAPCNLGLRPPPHGGEPGVRRTPDVLRARGLVERVRAEDAGRVEPPRYTGELDAESGVRHAPDLAAYSRDLADALDPLLDAGRIPLVIGGDCSILLGAALALRRRGRYGLLFLDGHKDLLTPATSRTGGAAGMDLALAVGIGPPALTALYDDEPLVLSEDVALLGYRDPDYWDLDPMLEPLRDQMLICHLDALRAGGIARVTGDALRRLGEQGVDGVWVHLDVDVLDDAIMPAVDSRQAGGMTLDEMAELLWTTLASGLVTGMQVTILDPDLDPDGSAAERVVKLLEEVLGG